MESTWQEIGINAQHVCETSTPDRYQLICDKAWLQALERRRKIVPFATWSQLDRRAHPTTADLEHPWTSILVQTYRKEQQRKVYPLPHGISDSLINCDSTSADYANIPLSFSQAVAYVANTNFKKLWETSYKRYAGAHIKICRQQNGCSGGGGAGGKLLSSPTECGLLAHDVVLKELIQRIFHCPLIHCKVDRCRWHELDDDENAPPPAAAAYAFTDCNASILPALVAIETSMHFCIFFYPPPITCSLYDCITYSPAVLGKSYNKSLFMIYQLFQLSKALQTQGLFLGDLRLQHIMLRDNLWLQVLPQLKGNMLWDNSSENDIAAFIDDDDATEGDDAMPGTIAGDDCLQSGSTKFDIKFAYDLNHFTLREYTEMWCNGQLSNFDYLTILNNASGRSLHNPAHHHIMPWVTDFTARNGANWRDLTKSKYRLNKGDIHLDLMYTQAHQSVQTQVGDVPSSGNGIQLLGQQTPHHVSDFLSEITYFVYMARRTPQQILCAHVRPIWVPAEYPATIKRLEEWSPDECIPEFYSDPMIFKSIHEDLPDLELPSWASCPEDFICKHREALESQHVSERLHHWIDLNFGHKLSGKAAIKSKNVCLSMVDQHRTLCQRGIVQLFTQPHPPKRFPNAWFSKTAPRLSQLYNNNNKAGRSPKNRHKLHVNETSKRLAKSTENLHVSSVPDMITNGSNSSPRMSLHPTSTTSSEEKQSSANFYPTTNFIELPKDFNPAALLQSLETMESFFARTFPNQQSVSNPEEKIITSDLMFEDNSEEHSFTNQLFADDLPIAAVPPRKCKNFIAPVIRKRSLKHKLSEKRESELQVLGCLIVELFMLQRVRPLLTGSDMKTNFETRLQACRTVAELHKQELPKCLRYIVRVLLQTQTVSDLGLAPISAAQILEPIFATTLIPFPNHYYAIYGLVRALHAFDCNSTLLELQTHFNCNGRECAKYTDIDRKRVLFERKIAECKVMSCCAHIRRLLDTQAYEQFSPVELLLPHIIHLLSTEQTSILTAWYLFDPVAQALGLAQTQQHLLLPIMKLYDVESFERGMTSVRTRSIVGNGANAMGHLRFSTSSSFKSRKSVKLYHHSFLLRLIVRFGLRCFLQHFIAPLIEAVGGYKEPEDGNGLHYHSGVATGSRRTSKNLSYAAVEEHCGDGIYIVDTQIPQDDVVTLETVAKAQKPEVEDVFSFEDDANSDHISNSGTAENKSIDSFDMRCTATAEEAKEDFAERTETTEEKLAISEIIYGSKISNTSFEESDKISIKSQNESTQVLGPIGPKSPTIDIPASVFRHSYQLNAIDCEIGSRKSVDSFDIITQAVEDAAQQECDDEDNDQPAESRSASSALSDKVASRQTSMEACDSLQASVISKMSEAKAIQNNRISEMSAESLIWLSHRLGPVLTSRFITRNLLKMLTLCYVGQENLLPESSAPEEIANLNYFSIADARVVGDRSAARVLECLMSISALFGEEILLLQYFPHISELIALSAKRLTGSLEGAIISSLQLLKYMVPCLKDVTIMEHLKDIILDSILLPILRILSSTRINMPSGYLGRSLLARKLLDASYALSVRIGPDMSKEHLCQPLLRPFFLIFDKAYGITGNPSDNIASLPLTAAPPHDSSGLTRAGEELRDVFGPALAHTAYLIFLRFLGEAIMQRTIKNLELVLTLCHEFNQPNYNADMSSQSLTTDDTVDGPSRRSDISPPPADTQLANSFGTQVIGNRIEVAATTNEPTIKPDLLGPMEVLDMVAHKFEQFPTSRHLKGNWLAYWRHEITRSDKETSLNLKQIRLQSFAGHTNSVRAILALDNENSFISASKDKTVKLWSLRSEGDGRKKTACQFTYTAHKKSIHSLSFLESLRYVVSCDSGVHIWDPFIGRPLGTLDSSRHNPITVVKCLPSPSPLIIAGTAESSVKIIDARTMQYVNEWRVSNTSQANATVRCLTVAPSGNWIAVGLSSGGIVMLDTRTGIILNAWRPIECDLLQLAAPNDQQLVSSALDHSLAVWHAQDGILHYQLRPPAEPAHFLQTVGSELIFATTGNRIGVYDDISSSHAAYSVTKLRSETFRGVLTSLAVLPLNRAFLAGNESGNIVLLC